MKILSLNEIEHTHGTVQLINHGGNLQVEKGTDIVLIPQPNPKDPNDPLNWPRPKRLAAFYSILLFSALCNFLVTGLAPGFGQLFEEFGSSVEQLTYLISACALGQGAGCYLVAPLSVRFGKRPVWLVCAVIYFVCNIWAAKANSYVSLLLARILAAWASGVSEPLSVDALNDLFFLHERGKQAGMLGLWLSAGASLAPIVGGYLIEAMGWRWFHWLITILGGLNILLLFFLCPETQYSRDLHKAMEAAGANEQMSHDEESPEGVDQKISSSEHKDISKDGLTTVPTATSTASHVYTKKTYLQELNPYSGVRRDKSLLAAYLRPWPLFLYPSIIWASLCFAMNVSCVVVLTSILPLEISAPPYNFSAGQQGLTFIAALIGNAFGSYVGGYCNDLISQRSARKNGGVFEPEMRLPVVIFPGVMVPAGLIMFGVGIHNKSHWILPVFGFGMVAIGLNAIPSVVEPYLLDSYYPVAMETIIIFLLIKNLISFAIGFAVVPWIQANGIVAVFCILAALVVVIHASALVLYFYGKRFREIDARRRIFPF